MPVLFAPASKPVATLLDQVPGRRLGSAAQLDLNENREQLVFALRFFERQHEAVAKISLFVDVEVPFIFRPAKHRPFFCQLEP
jgi:hypothetical protein